MRVALEARSVNFEAIRRNVLLVVSTPQAHHCVPRNVELVKIALPITYYRATTGDQIKAVGGTRTSATGTTNGGSRQQRQTTETASSVRRGFWRDVGVGVVD